MRSIASEMFCGQVVSQDLLGEIVVIVETFPKLTRTELANTICELFSWKRPTGKLKTVECRQFLECLDARGIIQLPACNHKYIRLTQPSVDHTRRTDCQPIISAKLSELTPIWLDRVRDYAQRQLWTEYINRYHYLGYRIPFGAQLRYFIQSGVHQASLGCLQFSSPAWRMAARDQWIGWSDEQRRRNLQKDHIQQSLFNIPLGSSKKPGQFGAFPGG
jgi:hypothetical protein